MRTYRIDPVAGWRLPSPLLLSVHDQRPGGGLAAISWTGQKLNVVGKGAPALLA